jgi:WD40 repeat protein
LRRRDWALGLALALVVGCAAAVPEVKSASTRRAPTRSRGLDVEIFYKGDQPWARRGGEEYALGDVTRGEMVFSPDGRRFAYVRQAAQASAGRTGSAAAHVLVRNLAGDPVNDFAIYRPGMPEQLTWIDNRRIGYVAPSDAAATLSGRKANLFVVHDADSGEVLAARAGAEFLWDAQHHHVAFVTGAPGRQVLVVDGKNVWPRTGSTRLHGEPSWGPDGHGLAIVEEGQGTPRLVVLVEFQDAAGDLTWPVPREALEPGLKVFWATESKVVIGESTLKPKFAAGWERLQ